MLSPIYINEELGLHEAHPDMAEALLQVLQNNRLHFMPFLPWAKQIKTIDQARQFLRETALFNRGRQKFILFVYFRKKLIGSVGLMRIDQQNAKAEIGFWLGSEWEGKSLISTSLRVLIRKAFTHFHLHRLEMRISAQNHRAIQLASALGFHREGTLREAIRHDNTFHNTVVFGFLLSDWEHA